MSETSIGARGQRAARAPDPLQHRQPARQRAPGAGVSGRPSRPRPASSASCSAPSPSGRTSWRGCAAARRRRRGPRSATSATSTRCSPTRPSGRTTRGRARLADGCLWGRGALDMKSQVAAEIAAAASLARSGWRPARGELLIVAVVDEETGGALGARVDHRARTPRRCAATCSSTRAAARVFEYGGRRCYGVCCAEKGVFRFTRHAPTAWPGTRRCRSMGENALLKMAPVLERLGARQPSYQLTAEPQRVPARHRRGPRGSRRARSRGCARPTRAWRRCSSRCSA